MFKLYKMKKFLALYLSLFEISKQQVLKTRITDCFDKRNEGYFFCNHRNKSIKKTKKSNSFITYGYCCPKEEAYSRHPNCTPNTLSSNGYRCT